MSTSRISPGATVLSTAADMKSKVDKRSKAQERAQAILLPIEYKPGSKIPSLKDVSPKDRQYQIASLIGYSLIGIFSVAAIAAFATSNTNAGIGLMVTSVGIGGAFAIGALKANSIADSFVQDGKKIITDYRTTFREAAAMISSEDLGFSESARYVLPALGQELGYKTIDATTGEDVAFTAPAAGGKVTRNLPQYAEKLRQINTMIIDAILAENPGITSENLTTLYCEKIQSVIKELGTNNPGTGFVFKNAGQQKRILSDLVNLAVSRILTYSIATDPLSMEPHKSETRSQQELTKKLIDRTEAIVKLMQTVTIQDADFSSVDIPVISKDNLVTIAAFAIGEIKALGKKTISGRFIDDRTAALVSSSTAAITKIADAVAKASPAAIRKEALDEYQTKYSELSTALTAAESDFAQSIKMLEECAGDDISTFMCNIRAEGTSLEEIRQRVIDKAAAATGSGTASEKELKLKTVDKLFEQLVMLESKVASIQRGLSDLNFEAILEEKAAASFSALSGDELGKAQDAMVLLKSMDKSKFSALFPNFKKTLSTAKAMTKDGVVAEAKAAITDLLQVSAGLASKQQTMIAKANECLATLNEAILTKLMASPAYTAATTTAIAGTALNRKLVATVANMQANMQASKEAYKAARDAAEGARAVFLKGADNSAMLLGVQAALDVGADSVAFARKYIDNAELVVDNQLVAPKELAELVVVRSGATAGFIECISSSIIAALGKDLYQPAVIDDMDVATTAVVDAVKAKLGDATSNKPLAERLRTALTTEGVIAAPVVVASKAAEVGLLSSLSRFFGGIRGLGLSFYPS